MRRSTRIAVKTLPAGWKRKKFYRIRAEAAQQLWVAGSLKNMRKEDHLEAKVEPHKEE